MHFQFEKLLHEALIQQKISMKERKKKQDAEMAGRAGLVYKVDLTPVQARASISQIIQASKTKDTQQYSLRHPQATNES